MIVMVIFVVFIFVWGRHCYQIGYDQGAWDQYRKSIHKLPLYQDRGWPKGPKGDAS